jgi:hypothetical protein
MVEAWQGGWLVDTTKGQVMERIKDKDIPKAKYLVFSYLG